MATRLIKCCSFPGDTVGDLHVGSGTTAGVAVQLGRHFTGGDINPEAVKRSRAHVAGRGRAMSQ
jgi:DNA modification methylase